MMFSTKVLEFLRFWTVVNLAFSAVPDEFHDIDHESNDASLDAPNLHPWLATLME